MQQTESQSMTVGRQFDYERSFQRRKKIYSRVCNDIVSTVLSGYTGPVAIRLWNGELACGMPDASTMVTVHDPGVLRELLLHRDLLRLTDAYLAGLIDVEGDMEALFDLKQYLAAGQLSRGSRLRLLGQALRLPTRTPHATTRGRRADRSARRNSRASIEHHYDVSNEFYRLWLGPEMLYSCPYISSADQLLAEAQRDKQDYLCRKLLLHTGQTFHDIG